MGSLFRNLFLQQQAGSIGLVSDVRPDVHLSLAASHHRGGRSLLWTDEALYESTG